MRPTVKLWEICDVISWQSPESKYYNESGEWLPFFQWKTEFTEKYIWTPKTWTKYTTKESIKNDILMSVRAPVWPVNINWFDKICIWRWLCAIRPSNKVELDYLFNFLLSIQEQLTWNRGSVFASINRSQIENIEIPLPPLETQKAIVAKLDQIFAELDQAKSEIQKNLDNTDELWKSALNQAFQGDWEMKTLQDVCLQKITDWTHQTPTYCGEKEWIPFISSKDVTKEYIDREWLIKHIPQSLHEELYARIAPQKDDVLLAKNWTTWVAAIVEDDRIFDIYVTLAVLRPNQKIITPRFLHRIVNSPICKRQFDKSLKWAGVPNLHLENIKTVTIPVPPLSEQEKIVEHLDQVSKEVKALKSQYQSQLDNLEELKKSVLDKAFRWEIGE